jgi:hypothetical protein
MKNEVNIFKWIKVTFQVEGIHCYPDAKTDSSLATGNEYDVSFLSAPHRHVFHFTVQLSVSHSNREVEFIQFKRWCQKQYSKVLSANNKSCEMLAEDLYNKMQKHKVYKNRNTIIEVSEDGENGAVVEFLQ